MEYACEKLSNYIKNQPDGEDFDAKSVRKHKYEQQINVSDSF